MNIVQTQSSLPCPHDSSEFNFRGMLLVANPTNPSNALEDAVMLVVNQVGRAIMALQVNRVLRGVELEHIVNNLGFSLDSADQQVFYGGGLGGNKLHFIHTLDWSGLTTIRLGNNLGVTSDISILAALSESQGPQQYRACAGHWSWDLDTLHQQLDTINNPDVDYKWETLPADEATVFDLEGHEQWQKCLEISADLQATVWLKRLSRCSS